MTVHVVILIMLEEASNLRVIKCNVADAVFQSLLCWKRH
jgi:hypothetical protein